MIFYITPASTSPFPKTESLLTIQRNNTRLFKLFPKISRIPTSSAAERRQVQVAVVVVRVANKATVTFPKFAPAASAESPIRYLILINALVPQESADLT